MIEQWGSGVKRIFKEAEELGLPELQIIELGMRLRVIVPLLKPIVLREDKSPKSSGAESNMTMRIIAMLEEKPLAKLEIANCLGKEKPTRYLNELMRKLLNEDLVEYTLPEIPKSRLQKYRLTRKGEKLLGMDEEGREKIS